MTPPTTSTPPCAECGPFQCDARGSCYTRFEVENATIFTGHESFPCQRCGTVFVLRGGKLEREEKLSTGGYDSHASSAEAASASKPDVGVEAAVGLSQPARFNVTRYGEMHNEPQGKWVRFEDYEKLCNPPAVAKSPQGDGTTPLTETPKPIDSLTEQELRMECAIMDGWTRQESKRIKYLSYPAFACEGTAEWKNPEGEDMLESWLPNYPASRDAVIEAVLRKDEKFRAWFSHQMWVIADTKVDPLLLPAIEYARAFAATARKLKV